MIEDSIHAPPVCLCVIKKEVLMGVGEGEGEGEGGGSFSVVNNFQCNIILDLWSTIIRSV